MGSEDFSEKIIYTLGSSPSEELTCFGRGRTCCFTGHRPEKLPGRGDPDFTGYKNMKKTAADYAELLIKRGFDTFITGMSRGFDLMMAEYLLDECKSADSLNIICAVPYPGQYREMRSAEEKRLYSRILERAGLIAVSSPSYMNGCYAIRNQLMINCSSAVIGYLSSRNNRSGTMQTVNMAFRAGLEMYIMYGDENPRFSEI